MNTEELVSKFDSYPSHNFNSERYNLSAVTSSGHVKFDVIRKKEKVTTNMIKDFWDASDVKNVIGLILSAPINAQRKKIFNVLYFSV